MKAKKKPTKKVTKKTIAKTKPLVTTTPKKSMLWVLLVACAGIIALSARFSTENGSVNSFIALGGDTHKEGEFYIEASAETVDQAETATFMSYTAVSTSAVPTESDWNVEEDTDDDDDNEAMIPIAYASIPEESQMWLDRHSTRIESLFVIGGTAVIEDGAVTAAEAAVEVDTEPPSPIILKNCIKSSKCMVTIGNSPGKYTITAKAKGKTVITKLKVNKRLKPNPFGDTVPDWAAEAAYMLESNNIMRGYTDGTFAAQDPVTRGQLALLLYRIRAEYQNLDVAKLVEGKSCNIYNDVPADHYAYNAICYGTYASWFKGIAIIGPTFNPNQGLTRREVAQIIYNVIGKELIENKNSPYTDVTLDQLKLIATGFKDIPKNDPNLEPIGALYLLAIMNGTVQPDDTVLLSPTNIVNRGETAAILWRTLQKIDKYLTSQKSNNEATI